MKKNIISILFPTARTKFKYYKFNYCTSNIKPLQLKLHLAINEGVAVSPI